VPARAPEVNAWAGCNGGSADDDERLRLDELLMVERLHELLLAVELLRRDELLRHNDRRSWHEELPLNERLPDEYLPLHNHLSALNDNAATDGGCVGREAE
jgi:hypothetical protein